MLTKCSRVDVAVTAAARDVVPFVFFVADEFTQSDETINRRITVDFFVSHKNTGRN